MANITAWLVGNNAPSASERAVLAWRRIQDKPTSITIKRDSITLPAQTVRIEYSESERLVMGEANGASAVRDVVVFGIKTHPTLANTDLKYGDMFAFDGAIFRVVMTISTIGEIQAKAEAIR